MEHAKRAERFLIDALPAIDDFSSHLVLPDYGRRTVVFNAIQRVRLKDDGLYELVFGGEPLRISGDDTQYKSRYGALAERIGTLEAQHNVRAQPAYYATAHGETGPAVEVGFDGKRILTTIGQHYLMIRWAQPPIAPTKSLGQWYPGMLGATDAHNHCLKFSPDALTGEFEHNGMDILTFTLREEGGAYLINSPVKIDREHLKLVENRSALRERHQLSSEEPQYHLATFLHMLS